MTDTPYAEACAVCDEPIQDPADAATVHEGFPNPYESDPGRVVVRHTWCDPDD